MAASKPELRDGLAVCELDGERLLYDEFSGEVHHLNLAASLITDLCDGTVTVRGMAEAIADVYEMPFDDVHGQVRRAVRELRAAGILAPIRRGHEAITNGDDEVRGFSAELTSADKSDRRKLVRIQVPLTP